MHAFFAFVEEEEFIRTAGSNGIERFTEFTVVEPDALRAELARVRHRGYSTSIRQFNLAQGAAAAPVFERSGRPNMLLGALGFSSQLDESNVDEVGEALRACADRITGRTGGAVPTERHADDLPA